MSSKDRSVAAVVLAAGRSTRFRSDHSKLTHPVCGRPMIEWVLRPLREIGIAPVIVVVGHREDEVRSQCGNSVVYVRQSEQRGTGHAVLMARPVLEKFAGDVLIVNGDLPLVSAESLRQLISARTDGPYFALATTVVEDSTGWGRIVRRDGKLIGIVEERDATAEQRLICEVNVGLYCASPALLFGLLDRVNPDNAQQEIYLTDVAGKAVREGACVKTVQIPASEALQINSRKELAAVEAIVRQRINEQWMDRGVTFEDPATAYIEPEVVIGRDTVIGPNVQLRGRTVIGAECRLDGSARLVDARIGDRVHVKFGVVITDATVEADCMIGPFAQLRPGTHLHEGVHIGDFVETKNAVFGRGAKANHLAYLGDAEIGAETNIGAGTITCNYDGFRKSKTVIGSRVQIGSDSQLVAPVTVGDDAYIATGTTVRKDVPPGALAYYVKDERHRLGWVAARRKKEGALSNGPVEKSRMRPKAATRQAKSKGRSRKAITVRQKSS